MTTLPAPLADLLTRSFAVLEDGARDPDSAWRHPALATVAPDGRPGIRTIVLRRFHPARRIVELHTDARSPKMAALAHDPRAALHFWGPARRIQLRLDGVITLADDEAVQSAWDALHDGSRATYASAQAPGTPIADPAGGGAPCGQDEARRVFRVLQLRFEVLEYLSLAPQARGRARFVWQDQACDATWLVP
jgi:pyridoxamine 5'-phosphate oxidase